MSVSLSDRQFSEGGVSPVSSITSSEAATSLADAREFSVGTGAVVFVCGSIAAAALSVAAPLATAVFGLMLFGVLHNVLEIRCLANRYSQPLAGRRAGVLFALLIGLLLVIAGCRYLVMLDRIEQSTAWLTELGASYAAIFVVVIPVLLRRTAAGTAGAALILSGAAIASYTWPRWHFLVLTHLHNLLPAAFVLHWAWRRTAGARGRGFGAFAAAQVFWMGVIPFVMLSGAADRMILGNLDRWTGSVVTGGAERAAMLLMPPQWMVNPASLGRVLAVFAYLQLMHYFVWVGFLPTAGYLNPDKDINMAQEPGVARATRTRIYMGGGFTLAAVVFLVFLADYWTGRSLYGAITTFHVYLELPIVLLLVAAAASSHNPDESRSKSSAE